MAIGTKIGWTDATWSPVTGCTKVSPGCLNCYAEVNANRWWGERKFTDIQCHPGRLGDPLKWRKPQKIFVNSMSDLFHPDVPDSFRDQVFAVATRCPQHVFQVLTKRTQTMSDYFGSATSSLDIALAVQEMDPSLNPSGPDVSMDLSDFDIKWPLENVWLGTSCEDQKHLDERAPWLLKTPAAVRFLSLEPLLGPIDLPIIYDSGEDMSEEDRRGFGLPSTGMGDCGVSIDWVIVGGESGRGFRQCKIEWIDSIVEQCQLASVPVFVKQDSGPRPGQQGRIPDRLWIKEFPDG